MSCQDIGAHITGGKKTIDGDIRVSKIEIKFHGHKSNPLVFPILRKSYPKKNIF